MILSSPDENVQIKLRKSKFINNSANKFFVGELYFSIKDRKKLYKYFQTRKESRKLLNDISIFFKYNFKESRFIIEKLELNKISNQNIQDIIDRYNEKNLKSFKKIDIKNFFNDIVSAL